MAVMKEFRLKTTSMNRVDDGREITFAAASGMPLYRQSWFGTFKETLHCTKGAVDLGFFEKGGGRILADHNRSINSVLGIITGADVRNDKVFIKALFRDDVEEQKDTADKIENGTLRMVSVGWDAPADGVEFRDTGELTDEEIREGADFAIDYRKWVPREVSFVTVPADDGVGVGRSEDTTFGGSRHLESVKQLLDAQRAKQRKALKGGKTMENENLNENSENLRKTIREEMEEMEDKKAAKKEAEAEDSKKSKKEMDDEDKPTDRGAGYKEIRASRDSLLATGMSRDEFDAFCDMSVDKNWTAAEAREALVAKFRENSPKLARSYEEGGRSAAVHVGDKRRDRNSYSLARAIQQAFSGRLKTGRGSLEAEIHSDLNEANGRTLSEFEHALPISLLATDRKIGRRMAGRVKNDPDLKRALEAGDAGNAGSTDATDGYAGVLVADFDETHIVETLYDRGGLFSRVSTFPQMLNQDLKVPVENNTHASGWIGASDEDADRADTTAPDYPTNLVWSWHEVYSQFGITRRLVDQTAYLYDRLIRLLERDLPRNINLAMWGAPAITNAPDGVFGTTTVTSTAVGDNGGTITYQDLVDMTADLTNANADYLGDAMWFMNSASIADGLKTEKFTSSSGDTIIDGRYADMKSGAMNLCGYPIVKDNMLRHNISKGTGRNLREFAFCIPSEIRVGYFSDMVMVVDPYTNLKQGETNIQIRQAMDWQIEHPQAFSVRQDVSGFVKVA